MAVNVVSSGENACPSLSRHLSVFIEVNEKLRNERLRIPAVACAHNLTDFGCTSKDSPRVVEMNPESSAGAYQMRLARETPKIIFCPMNRGDATHSFLDRFVICVGRHFVHSVEGVLPIKSPIRRVPIAVILDASAQTTITAMAKHDPATRKPPPTTMRK